MPVTIKDIARRLDLSVSTVSYALNGGPKPVSSDVKEKVLRMAEELNYRPNRLAKSLVTRRSHTIGVVPVDVEQDILLTPCVHLVLNGVVNAAAAFRQDVLLFTAHDRNLPDEVADDILDSRVDGVVFIAPRPDSPALRRIADSDLPYAIVAADDGLSPCYLVDNGLGTNLALQYLYDLGHRRIAHQMGRPPLMDAGLRLDAYKAFMAEKGLDVPSGYIIPGNYWRDSGYTAALKILQMPNRPTAVFCANDEMAFGLIQTLMVNGINVPEDISVVGFDDAPLAGNSHPPLTTVRQPLEAMATEALRAVMHQILTGASAAGQIFAPELVIRGSAARSPEDIIQ